MYVYNVMMCMFFDTLYLHLTILSIRHNCVELEMQGIDYQR